ncbi:phytoene desaturase family protein [Curtobacterium flaccumfaciens]|uniref:phytoene desaturase family protein n=1 Tax=Curtobacterium flaccumfaciens TaxID=2035 RepID=UPI00159908F2|nr:phytoene desaturase family protein [Curtobacterium flaccumfaciens]MCS0471479.1 phytoene desaturase family protein [Curtobacterium flaccumfaciens pv. betae]MCS0473234.1 phytoene desaturase family protein [Curtobacterium flaccumfaciens pv. betae]MCS0478077.1 phytoene desaturase family protein [Curtobacterium flaccumfaciens pv. betae]MCS0480004.1 phytoene desaturase family protein [Curtobacterium flaccumfaciens pv. betae]MCS0485364.1 phytoene desaturase family protein [Curtobacterium flaccumfa
MTPPRASRPTTVATTTRRKVPARRAVVIGGGISGLAAAALLARDGFSVTVLEQRTQLGGRAGSWEQDGFRFDTGPSWYLMPEVFDHFFQLLGTSAEAELDLVKLDPGYRVYSEGHDEPIDLRADAEANIALFESIEPGAGERMRKYLASAEDTYTMAVRRFLYTSFQDLTKLAAPDVLRRLPKLARLLLEPLSTFAETAVRDRRLWQILGYPAVFLGTSPYAAPSMYHLMSHLDLADGVLYPKGGITEVISAVERVARAEGAKIIAGAKVERIVVEDGVATGVVHRDRDGVQHTAPADLVVSAADMQHTEMQLLDREHRTHGADHWKKRDPGPSAVLVYLGIDGPTPGLLHHTLVFTADWKANFGAIFGDDRHVPDPASIYVCAPSETDPSVSPPGTSNLFILVPLPADLSIGKGGIDGAGDYQVEQIADRAIDVLAERAGVPDLRDRIRVRRTIGPRDFADDLNAWNGSMLGPAHTLKQSAFFREKNASKKVEGLYYVGASTIPGIGLPMCLISAEVLLKRIHGDRSTEPLPTPLGAQRDRTETA